MMTGTAWIEPLDALLQRYPLYDEVVPLLGERRAQIFCHAISAQNDCLVCSTFFRRLLADAGDDPDALALDELDVLLDGYLEPYRARVA
jgi:hypothetical protein